MGEKRQSVDAENPSTDVVPFVFSFVVACAGNSPAAPDQALCTRATTVCAPGQLQYWVFRSPTGLSPPRWQAAGTQCVAPAAVAAAALAAPAFPGFTLADFQRLPLPAGRANVQPATGYTLVGVATNVYADAAPVQLATQVAGFPVQVRAEPAHYTWTFGDTTSTGPTTDPGAPYPALRLAHPYTTPGHYPITLITTYTGQYSVAGGAWLPIDGEAHVTSPPVPIDVLSAHSALVNDLTTR